MQPHHGLTHIIATLLLTLAGLLWLTGCTTLPEPIRAAPAQPIVPAQAQAAPEQHKGAPVRWGGIIATVINLPSESLIEVVARPLEGDGRPEDSDRTTGRFLARLAGFIDPVAYAAGRELTVVGTLAGVEQRKIGEYAYLYPVVRVTGHYLWPLRPPPLRDPLYYPPYYRRWPYYPYGPFLFP